ncbi:MAG: hypothetical protein ACI353_04300 [Alloprevotella sp.]
MKKITLLFALFTTIFGGVMAQITSLEATDPAKEYTIKCSRSGLIVPTGSEAITTCVQAGVSFNAADPQQKFKFLQEGENYYLYSVSAAKYVCKDKSLSETATDPIYFAAHDDGTTVQPYFDASQYRFNVDSYSNLLIDSWSTADAGNHFAIAEAEEGFDITYNVMYNDEVVATETVLQARNTMPALPASLARDFFTYTYDKTDAITEACTINATFQFTPAFEVSADIASANWQAFDIHSNQNKYFLQYVADDADGYIHAPVTAFENDVVDVLSLSDDYLWAIVGDVNPNPYADDYNPLYKIYNKAAGADVYVVAGASFPTMGTAEDGSELWKVVASPSSIRNATCFQSSINANNYMNHQQNAGVDVLKYWQNPDEGSSCRSYSVNAAQLALLQAKIEYWKDYLDELSAHAGEIGYLSPFALQEMLGTVYSIEESIPYMEATGDYSELPNMLYYLEDELPLFFMYDTVYLTPQDDTYYYIAANCYAGKRYLKRTAEGVELTDVDPATLSDYTELANYEWYAFSDFEMGGVSLQNGMGENAVWLTVPGVSTTEVSLTMLGSQQLEMGCLPIILTGRDGPVFLAALNDGSALMTSNAVGEQGEEGFTTDFIFEEVASPCTSISTVAAGQQHTGNRIFDLSGRRVSKTQKGLYIVNGQKVLVK